MNGQQHKIKCYYLNAIFNVLLIVVTLFNVAFPDIFNVDTNVPGLLKEIL